jgi:ATP synthase subunit D
MQIAAFSLAEVSYAVGGDIGFQVQESVKQAKFRIKTKQENVSGVFLPQFEGFQKEEINDFGLTGLGKGGQQVQRCRETYTRAVEALVELASLQTAFIILDEVIKVVNRRVNAIEHVIIPRTENTIKCMYLGPSMIVYADLVQISTRNSMSSTEKNSTDSRRYRIRSNEIKRPRTWRFSKQGTSRSRAAAETRKAASRWMCWVSTTTMM